jgi:hypothetical protein
MRTRLLVLISVLAVAVALALPASASARVGLVRVTSPISAISPGRAANHSLQVRNWSSCDHVCQAGP